MSKNLKRAISLLLTIGVLSSAAGITVSAEDAAPEASPAAEATAAPEESTPASATTTTAAATDAYYEEAVGLVTTLGIVQGYTDGSIQPENPITRAEMATMILRMTNNASVATPYKNTFTDVDANHWAASTIQTAYDTGIINGMGDGTFAPDANVTYNQAVKMLICALGYDQYAEQMGGYPSGYLSVAAQKNIEVIKNVASQDGNAPATRGTVIKMIYNSLNALYPKTSGITSEGVEYTTEDGKTLASELLDVFTVEGIVTATSKTSIDSASNPADNQILIDGEIYYKGTFDAEPYVGYKVKAYYYEGSDGVREIRYVVPKTKQDTLTIKAEDVESIQDVRTDSATVNYYANSSTTRTRAAKCKSPVIVYNGKIITASDIPDDMEFEEFITPDVGEVVLNDYDNDGYYDVMFIKSYKTYVVTSATDKAINAKYEVDGVKKIDVDLDEDDIDLTITRNGSEISAKNLKKWEVLTVLASANKEGDRVITIEASTATVEGKVKELEADEEESEYYATIDGKRYEIDETFYLSGDISSGDEGTFHLDSLGRIAAVEGLSGSKLASNEEYGWLIWIKTDTSTQEVTAKMFTQSGETKSLEFADSLKLYGPTTEQIDAAKDKLTKGTIKPEDYSGWTDLKSAKQSSWNGNTLKVNDDSDDYEKLLMADDIMSINTMGDFQMRLVKYSVDSRGKIKSLAMPVITSNYRTEDDDRPVILSSNMTGVQGSGNLLGNQYLMSSEIPQIIAPHKIDDVNDTTTYKYSKVPGSNYINREGVSRDYFLAEFDGLKPTLLIEYVGSSSEPADYNYNSADDAPLMMISKIENVYDEAEEEAVYKITGYVNGNKVTYNTTTTTSVGECTSITAARDYQVSKLWSAVSDEYSGSDAPEFQNIRDALHVGDIVGVKTSGSKVNTMVRFLDAQAAEDLDLGVLSPSYASYNIDSRDAFACGKVDDVDTDDTLTIAIRGGSNISVDPGFYVDIYNAKTGKVEDGELVSDLVPYDDDDGTGDIVFARLHRMGIREIYAVRFE